MIFIFCCYSTKTKDFFKPNKRLRTTSFLGGPLYITTYVLLFLRSKLFFQSYFLFLSCVADRGGVCINVHIPNHMLEFCQETQGANPSFLDALFLAFTWKIPYGIHVTHAKGS